MNRRGFTLLEVLIATVIMAIAVAGVLSGLSTSLRVASRLTEHDRAALLARQKMDELLLDTKLPKLTPIAGTWGPEVTGGRPTGWVARITPWEMPAGAPLGTAILDRVELEIWWMDGDRRRTFSLEGFRRTILKPEDAAGAAQ